MVAAVPIYRTELKEQKRLDLDGFDAVVFSSPSTAESFFRLYDRLPPHLQVYVYGRFTKLKLTEYGVSEKIIITVEPGGSR